MKSVYSGKVVKSVLGTKLHEDLEDESEAIHNYGQRIHQAPSNLKGTLSEIQGDEKDHHRRLSKAISGLKKAGSSGRK